MNTYAKNLLLLVVALSCPLASAQLKITGSEESRVKLPSFTPEKIEATRVAVKEEYQKALSSYEKENKIKTDELKALNKKLDNLNGYPKGKESLDSEKAEQLQSKIEDKQFEILRQNKAWAEIKNSYDVKLNNLSSFEKAVNTQKNLVSFSKFFKTELAGKPQALAKSKVKEPSPEKDHPAGAGGDIDKEIQRRVDAAVRIERKKTREAKAETQALQTKFTRLQSQCSNHPDSLPQASLKVIDQAASVMNPVPATVAVPDTGAAKASSLPLVSPQVNPSDESQYQN